MERCEISLDEKAFLIGNIDAGLRNDGRDKFQYRPLEIETDCIKRAMGSARVRIGGNVVIATVKADLYNPPEEAPDKGKIEINIDCSPEALSRLDWATSSTPSGPRREIHTRFHFMLNEAYRSVDTSGLCLVPSVAAWQLSVTTLVAAGGGAAVYDAVSLAIKSALVATRLPVIERIEKDADSVEVKIAESETAPLPAKLLQSTPNVITLAKVGMNYVTDPSYEESLCSELKFVVAVSGEGKILSIFKEGCGCIHPSALKQNCMVLADISRKLEKELKKALSKLSE